jgi:hypothetical protein
MAERLAWGRLFACTRAREGGVAGRMLRAALTPVLPVALLVRHTRLQAARGVHLRRFVQAAPFVLLLQSAWSLGEAMGELTARP